MKTKKKTAFFLPVTLIVLMIPASYFAIVATSNKPPLEEIHNARLTLAKAQKNAAGEYAGETLKQAEYLYNQSISEWKLQNERFFVLRDYALTRELNLPRYLRRLPTKPETSVQNYTRTQLPSWNR